MSLTYVIDYVFIQTPDGNTWTDTSYDANFWQSYVDIFGEVRIVCRVKQAAMASAKWRQVNNASVEVAALPMYQGALDYFFVAGKIRSMLRELMAKADAVILRVPSNLGRCAARELQRTNKRYAVEVVGDPNEALAPGVIRMPGRAYFRSLFTEAQKSICGAATGVAYVAETLRKHYPAARNATALVCSDVRLSSEWFRKEPRHFTPTLQRRLLTVATLSQTYKGIDVLLNAIAQCRQKGFDISLTIVGDGRQRVNLEKLARRLCIDHVVTFRGVIPWGPGLIDEFDQADLFVLPSRVEAMPRALIEAMARGLPAIATDVGAVHEVLDSGEMVVPGDAHALAHRIIEVCRSARRLEAMSIRNMQRAARFSSVLLQPQWKRFQQEMRTSLKAEHSKLAA